MTDKSSSIYISADHLVADFPYDKEQVAAIKRIPGAKWDKVSKVWRAPMTSLEAIRQFGVENGIFVDEEILLFNVWKSKNEASGIYENGEWIYLSFRYDPVKVRSVKSLPGVTWHAKTMAWRVPVTAIQEAVKWADRFNEKVPDELREKADAIHKEQLLRTEGSRSTDADIEIVGLNGELLPYQRAGINYAANARRCFIADDMGLGKTLQAICTVEYVWDSYPVVVVCPPSLVLNWALEWNRWFAGRNVKTVTDRKTFPEPGTYDVVVVGYSNIGHWQKELSNHRSYIFDESHYCKNPTAQRTKAAIKIANSAPKEGLVLCLTGTPVTNRPNEYASQLDILGRLKDFGGLWGFYRRYCGAFRDRFGQWHIDGATNLEELNNMLRATCYIRRTKEQVLKELPEVRHAPVYMEIDAKSMTEYKKAKDDIVKYVMERAKEIAKELGEPVGSAAVRAKIRAESNEHLVRMSVLRKIAAKGKIKAVAEIVDSLIDAGEKVVIAAHHRDVVDELANRYGNMKIQGGMNVESVEAVKRRFQEESTEEAPVIVLSIQAAKTGHTLTAASNVVFVELPWTPADVDQTYSRCHRLGQKNAVVSTYLLAKGTIDEEIFSLINQKRDIINAAIEGISEEISEENIAQTLILSLFDQAITP
jgi:SWI/SNF-related matrix-associated actin-dependent regulator of chromatin subfamily A-like protein 1